ncbi:XrtA system polysaccharide deacetylase [Photobacterium jeanii]|uniref:XrtA system polysaccharide deacetylase n=1 Tax=Photobacterium jeanii TaxID=858640 RepID=UPI000831A04B|nr:XrtA system polysaccharide deacetylase [Photobacterium jeanii]
MSQQDMSQHNTQFGNANALTIDVEDYFHVEAFSNVVSRQDWGNKYPLRVEANTERILEILNHHQTKATFFVLGWVAEACPNLTRRIVAEGHELASHGFAHQHANKQTAKVFKQDIRRSKLLLEDQSGVEVKGYRAPSFSIGVNNAWAFKELHKAGFLYTSSTYPVKHDIYGTPDWPRFKYRRPEGIIEIPIPTLSLMGRNVPIGGGGYFRLYPYALSRYFIRQFLAQTQQPFSFYFHPWEVDPEQPKMAGISLKSRVRHYLNLKYMAPRVEQLLTDFNWDTMYNTYQLREFESDEKSGNQEDSRERLFSLGQLR